MAAAADTGAAGTGAAAQPSPAADRPSEPRPPGTGCIRGGSTREEVLRVMGQPDSIVFGAYVYGRSQIIFGYGVVQELSNESGNLILC